MNRAVFNLVEQLRDHLIDIMLDALEKEGGVYLSADQRDRLSNALADALMGNIQL